MASSTLLLLDLPNEMLLRICEPLSAVDIQRLRRVSRQLKTFVDDPTNNNTLAQGKIANSVSRIQENASALFDLPADDPTTYVSMLQAFFRNRGIRAPTHPGFARECQSIAAFSYSKFRIPGQNMSLIPLTQTILALHFQHHGNPEAELGWHWIVDFDHFFETVSKQSVHQFLGLLSRPPGLQSKEDLAILYDRIVNTPAGLFADAPLVPAQQIGQPKWYISMMESPWPIALPLSNRLHALGRAPQVAQKLGLPTIKVPLVMSYYAKTEKAYTTIKKIMAFGLEVPPMEFAAALEDVYIY